MRKIVAHIRDRLCRLICGARLFNSDMSLETDRLQMDNNRLREQLDAIKRPVNHEN